MPILRSTHYRATVQANNPRRHTIPIEAARYLLNDNDALPTCLDERALLVQITLIAQDQVLFVSPEMILHPAEGNVLTIPGTMIQGYPSKVPEGAYVVVKMLLLENFGLH